MNDMIIEKAVDDSHTGIETYTAEYQIREQDDLYDVQGDYVQFDIRPDRIRLRWTRNLGEGWVRDRHRSNISGYRVVKSGDTGTQRGHVDVWRCDYRTAGQPIVLTDYARSLPGLDALVDRLEFKLPASER